MAIIKGSKYREPDDESSSDEKLEGTLLKKGGLIKAQPRKTAFLSDFPLAPEKTKSKEQIPAAPQGRKIIKARKESLTQTQIMDQDDLPPVKPQDEEEPEQDEEEPEQDEEEETEETEESDDDIDEDGDEESDEPDNDDESDEDVDEDDEESDEPDEDEDIDEEESDESDDDEDSEDSEDEEDEESDEEDEEDEDSEEEDESDDEDSDDEEDEEEQSWEFVTIPCRDGQTAKIKRGRPGCETVIEVNEEEEEAEEDEDSDDEESDEEDNEDSEAEEPLPNIDVEAIIAEAEQKGREKADKIIEHAQEEAKKLIEQAKIYAESAKTEAHKEGFALGKEEGNKAGIEEFSSAMNEAKNLFSQIVDERNKLLLELEPELAGLSIGIAEKIIGEAIGVNPDIVVGVVRQAMSRMKSREQVNIKVNPEDYDRVSENKSVFAALVEGIKTLEITSDPRVDRGGCIIETNLGNSDARIKTQLGVIELAFKNAETGAI